MTYHNIHLDYILFSTTKSNLKKMEPLGFLFQGMFLHCVNGVCSDCRGHNRFHIVKYLGIFLYRIAQNLSEETLL